MTGTYRVTKRIDFCYGHRLLHYEGKCRHLHGHNGRVEIDLENVALDHRGMVIDFEEIKAGVKTWLDETLDHRMILSREDPLILTLLEKGEKFLAVDFNPTAENIARMIFEYAASRNFPVVEVRLWETPMSFAAYRG